MKLSHLNLKKPGCHAEVSKAEFGYVTDLNQFIHLHLVENEKYDNKEIVKKKENQSQSVVFAMFHAKDSWTNLKTALMKYKEQVNTLKEATWA